MSLKLKSSHQRTGLGKAFWIVLTDLYLDGQSASLLESAADEVSSIGIMFISFFQPHFQNI